jgi:hypothetical protein
MGILVPSNREQLRNKQYIFESYLKILEEEY